MVRVLGFSSSGRLARRVGLLMLFLLLLARLPLLAQASRIISPGELTSLLQRGQQLKLVLKNGTYAEGRLQEVTEAGPRLRITRSADASGLPKGVQVVSFNGLNSITVSVKEGNKRTKLPLVLCLTVGTLSLVAAGATEERQSTYIPLAAAFTVGLGVGGYYLGRSMDRQEVTFILK